MRREEGMTEMFPTLAAFQDLGIPRLTSTSVLGRVAQLFSDKSLYHCWGGQLLHRWRGQNDKVMVTQPCRHWSCLEEPDRGVPCSLPPAVHSVMLSFKG